MSLIKCKNLSKHFSTTRALDGVNLELKPGAPIALVGPNGAGKTTLFSLLCGFIKPTSGSVEILGYPAGHKHLLGKVSALPQDAVLDPNFTIISQLSLFGTLQGLNKKQAKIEALRVLGLVELTDIAKQKPDSLSHGMGKRVAIAQALIGDPDMVLLDEPTAGLDPANAKNLRELIGNLAKHTQFVISSHNLDELEKLCDQVIYLDKGKLSQSVSIHDSDQANYLTLTLKNSVPDEVTKILQTHPAVVSIASKQSDEYLIEFNKQLSDDLEVFIFQQLKAHGWQYKQLLNGRTLEDTLFS